MHKASQEETYRAIAEQFGTPLQLKLNQWAARKLQRELDELAALERDD